MNYDGGHGLYLQKDATHIFEIMDATFKLEL